MHAFDYIIVLLSFVYAAAVTHVLATASDIIIAWRRVTPSWLNAGWMVCSLLPVIAWWIGLWDMRAQRVWSMGDIAFFFVVSCLLYLQTRLVCPRIPGEGPVDLRAFHRQEGRKYVACFALVAAVTVATNALFNDGSNQWLAQNLAVAPMMLAAIAGAVFTRLLWVQAAAVLVQFAMWIWYFTALQPPLAG